MKLRLWGVRGSIPSPGPQTVRYGGNTTCLEIRTDNNELIIIDAGTGIFPLAQSLLPEMPVDASLFISHTHWDHIQGFPFFIPNFVPGNRLHIHGPFDPVSRKGIRESLAVQLEYSYFPVREVELKGALDYTNLSDRNSISRGSAIVTPVLMNHPVLNYGYHVACGGKSIFFTGDHEPSHNIYSSNDPEYEQYQAMIDQKEQAIIDIITGCDILVADSSYTPDEYQNGKIGWGHGTYDSSIAMARKAKVKRLVCTHHEPTRSDDKLEAVFAAALERNPPGDGDPEIMLAREGLEIEI
jgi:phosphoribosyl 1,2-cyclic phosphodiesterase